MNRGAFNDEIVAPAGGPRREFPVLPPLSKTFTPPGKLIACQTIRGPWDLVDDTSKLVLPDRARSHTSGVKYRTPIMRAIAVGPDCEHVQEDDLFFVAPGVQVQEVWYDGATYFIAHEDGTLGVIEEEFERDWREKWRESVEG